MVEVNFKIGDRVIVKEYWNCPDTQLNLTGVIVDVSLDQYAVRLDVPHSNFIGANKTTNTGIVWVLQRGEGGWVGKNMIELIMSDIDKAKKTLENAGYEIKKIPVTGLFVGIYKQSDDLFYTTSVYKTMEKLLDYWNKTDLTKVINFETEDFVNLDDY